MKSTHKYFPVNDEQRSWGLYATCVGHSVTEPGDEFPSRIHPDEYYFTWDKGRVLHEWQLVLLERGGGTVEFRRRRFTARKGSLIVLPPGCWHRYRPDTDTGWTTLWIGFGGDLANRLVGGAGFNKGGEVRAIPDEHHFHRLLADMVSDILGNVRAGVYSTAARIPLLIAALIDDGSDANDSSDFDVSEQIHLAQQHMLEHCGEEIDFDSLSSSLGMTYRSFRYLFAKETGTSPLQYHLSVKLSRAKNLLKSSDIPIEEIAHTLGFKTNW
ncbi:MAG: AraC family transcriptional regulator, partial [Kiritimatiellae bacterium]|nr:AraC family transcriptional regulator [Kiritimatiellia bacterium]